MTSVALFSLCFMVLLAHLNQVKCEGEMSLDDEELERMRREAAIELYHRLKRQGSVGVEVGKDRSGPYVRGTVDRQFGDHKVSGHVDWSKGDGLRAGASGQFTFNKGKTRVEPSVSVNRHGLDSVGVKFTREFGKRR